MVVVDANYKQIPKTAYAIQGRFNHIKPIAKNMRKEDVDEIKALTGKDQYIGLTYCFRQSLICWSIAFDGDLIGMFGLGENGYLSDSGVPWLLSTDRIKEAKFTILRDGNRYLDHMHSYYPKLCNYIWEKNYSGLKLLDYLGFYINPDPIKYGPRNERFFYFEKVKE